MNGIFNISPRKHHRIKALMYWSKIHLTMVMDPQVNLMFWIDQVQRLTNQFNTVETFKKDSLDQYNQINTLIYLSCVVL